MTTTNNQKGRKWLVLMLMILSMCTIYILPYLRYNLFTPLQEAMGLAGETEKYGNLVSVYGIMNVLMYLPGGIIADRFDPKKLMVFSMISSGALGLWMATWPGYEMLLIIHILWGVTTVLTFWSSSVKVVNMLAAKDEQGEMFGLLESGRGIVSLLLNFAWVGLFALFANNGNLGMTVVVTAVSVLMIISGILLAFLLPKSDMSQAVNTSIKDSLKALLGAFKLPITYVLAAMIFVPSAIVASGSYYAPYLQGAAAMSVVIASAFATLRGNGFPIVAAVSYSRLSKKIGRSSSLLMFSCIVLVGLTVLLRFIPGTQSMLWPLLIIMSLIAFFAGGCRAVNWAIIDESGTSKNMVGSVIGIASLIGYLPDTFIHTLYGKWIDKYDFNVAYGKIFNFCILVAVVGTVFAVVGERIIKKRQMEAKAMLSSEEKA
ncbi:MAG: MFS transporter [Lachnospiraceae bacterium]